MENEKKVPEIPDHLKEVYRRLILLPEDQPPHPWRHLPMMAVGGLTDVGFADSSDTLIAVSPNGRGLFDCLTGDRLDRDRSQDYEFDTANLLVRGIGPLANCMIRTAGLHGGGLANQTADGWRLECATLAWPYDYLFLSPPGHWALGPAFGKPGNVTRLPVFSELHAFGFSPTGNVMVVATSSDLDVYVRHQQTSLARAG